MKSLKPPRLFQRKIKSMRRIMGKRRGWYWVVTMECGHEKKMSSHRRALTAYCEKCALGLVRA